MRTQTSPVRAAVLGTLSLLLVGALFAPLFGGVVPVAAPHAGPAPLASPVGPSPRALSHAEGSPVGLASRPAAFSVSVTGTTPAAVALAWTNPGDLFFFNYNVEMSTNGTGGPWQSVGTITSAGTTSFTLGGLTPGAPYAWEVVETGLFGSQTAGPTSDTQPTLAYLTATMPLPTEATFNWTNNATYGGGLSFAGYTIFEAASAGTPHAVAWVNSSSVETVNVSGLTPGASYSFFLNTTDCISGCGAAGASNSSTVSNTLTLGTPLPLVASISAVRSVVDVGQPAYFVCTPSGGTSPFNFSWNLGTGRFVKGPSSESAAFRVAANYSVACLVTDRGHSQSSAGTQIEVNPDPEVVAITNRTAVDVGQSIAFDCAANSGTAPLTLGWTFGDGQGFSGGTDDHTYARNGTFPATCTVTDGTGTTASSTAVIHVSPLLDVLARASTSAVAPNGTVTFTAVPTNGSGTYTSYLWDFGDGHRGGGAVAHHAYTGAGAFTVALSVQDSNGANVTARTGLTVSAIVLVVHESTSSVAPGGTVTFTITASGGAGAPYTFTWNFGDGAVGHGSSATHTYAIAGTFHPSVEVLDRLNGSAAGSAGSLRVATPASPTSWFNAGFVLLLALLLGLIVGAVAYTIHRRRESVEHERYAGYVPPADPSRVVKGVKVCRACGTSNPPIRETCAHCGASLSRLTVR